MQLSVPFHTMLTIVSFLLCLLRSIFVLTLVYLFFYLDAFVVVAFALILEFASAIVFLTDNSKLATSNAAALTLTVIASSHYVLLAIFVVHVVVVSVVASAAGVVIDVLIILIC